MSPEDLVERAVLLDDQDHIANRRGQRPPDYPPSASNPLACIGTVTRRSLPISAASGKRKHRNRSAAAAYRQRTPGTESVHGVRADAVSAGVGHVHLVAIRSATPAPGTTLPADGPIPSLLRVDHADRVDARLGHQQPARSLVPRHPDRQHAAQCLQPGNANRDFTAESALVLESITVIESLVALERRYDRWSAVASTPAGLLPPSLLPEGAARADKRLNLGAAGPPGSRWTASSTRCTLGSPKPGTWTWPPRRPLGPPAASADGKPKAGKGSPVSRAFGSAPGTALYSKIPRFVM